MRKNITWGHGVLLALILLATACTDKDGAFRALRQAGYTHIETGGYPFWGCGDHDTFKTKFKALGPSGIPVSGVVCSGWLKGNTIRLD